jgi:hypothetical protein
MQIGEHASAVFLDELAIHVAIPIAPSCASIWTAPAIPQRIEPVHARVARDLEIRALENFAVTEGCGDVPGDAVGALPGERDRLARATDISGAGACRLAGSHRQGDQCN